MHGKSHIVSHCYSWWRNWIEVHSKFSCCFGRRLWPNQRSYLRQFGYHWWSHTTLVLTLTGGCLCSAFLRGYSTVNGPAFVIISIRKSSRKCIANRYFPSAIDCANPWVRFYKIQNSDFRFRFEADNKNGDWSNQRALSGFDQSARCAFVVCYKS